MIKHITVIFLIFLSYFSYSQQISFSKQISQSNDKSVIKVKEKWNAYINECIINTFTGNKDYLQKYWNKTELKDNRKDIVKDNISSKYPIYLFGEVFTFEIIKIDSNFYKLKSMVIASDSVGKNVLAIFTNYAKIAVTDVKFYNYFFYQKEKLKKYQAKNIDFYYPPNCKFDTLKAKQAVQFYQMLSSQLDFAPNNRLTYIVADNLEDANKLLGYDYTVRNTTNRNSGYYQSNYNLIVTCQEFHKHEIVHSIFDNKFPYSPRILHEGIATYYGGTNGNDLEFHIKKLQTILNSDTNIDLSDFKSLDKEIDNCTNLFYTVGAIFIDYAYKNGGFNKVMELFKNTNSGDDIYSTLNEALNIKKDQINSFIKNYLKDYK